MITITLRRPEPSPLPDAAHARYCAALKKALASRAVRKYFEHTGAAPLGTNATLASLQPLEPSKHDEAGGLLWLLWLGKRGLPLAMAKAESLMMGAACEPLMGCCHLWGVSRACEGHIAATPCVL